LQERPRVRLLLRRDAFRRFYSCLVFVPREKYNTQVRQRIERVIGEAFLRIQHGIAGADRRVESRAHPHRGADQPERRKRVDTDDWSGASPRPCDSWFDEFKAALLRHFPLLTPKIFRAMPPHTT
jgi:hypothetical protein